MHQQYTESKMISKATYDDDYMLPTLSSLFFSHGSSYFAACYEWHMIIKIFYAPQIAPLYDYTQTMNLINMRFRKSPIDVTLPFFSLIKRDSTYIDLCSLKVSL